MRSPAAMDILVIDITNRCFLNCSNCTRLIAHQSKTLEMTPDQLRAALRSLQGWDAPGRVVGLIGGEPTLHSQFEELCRVFREEWRPGCDCDHGRNPIGDFNAFATERLFDRRNGRGLWTSFGPRFVGQAETIFDTFSHWNPNDHSAGGLHQALLIHRDDYCAQTGTTPAEWAAARDRCWVQNMWSASINTHGAYFCEVAAAIDRTLYGGKSAWPVEAGWWRREPKDFADQLHLCDHCSLAQRGPSSVDSVERDIVSNKNRIALELVGSPAIKGGRFDEYGPLHIEEQRSVETKDSYTAGPRVSAENEYVRPKKLTAIVTCVGRAEHLRQTLRHNAAQVDDLIVVKATDDQEDWYDLDGLESPNVRTCISDKCSLGDAAFNKGALLNSGLKCLASPDWILFTDADVFLPSNLREWFHSHTLNPGVLYGASRRNGDGPILPGVNTEANGFFQLWNPKAHAIRDRMPAPMSEAFCSAGGIDSWLLQQWPQDKVVRVPELVCVHIEHTQQIGSGWNGERRAGQWRQCGMLTARGIGQTEQVPPGKLRLRLTDTRYGESIDVELGDDGLIPETILADNGRGGLIFNGKDIGDYHIHLAYWLESKPEKIPANLTS